MALPYVDPVIDAISVSIPLARLSTQRELEVVDLMRQMRDRITRVVNPMGLGGF